MKMIPPVRATEQGTAQIVNRHCRIVVLSGETGRAAWRKSFWKKASERVRIPYAVKAAYQQIAHLESCTLELVHKCGGNFLLKLNTVSRPIANKYREGKVKRTLKRELKVPEIDEM
jgi:hypothetical protein